MKHIRTYLILLSVIFCLCELCPYPDPAAKARQCIEGMPSLPAKQEVQNHTYTHAQSAPKTEEESSLTLNVKFMNYFCSDAGHRMVACTKDLLDHCGNHPLLQEVHFNTSQATLALSLCGKYIEGFRESYQCLNEHMKKLDTLSCVFDAYKIYVLENKSMSKKEKSCSATATVFNCYVDHIGKVCGEMNIGFAITVMRSMEDKQCRPIIDRLYRDPMKSKSCIPISDTILLFIMTGLVYVFLLS